jgi:polyisoprenoid-binding protein YceI
MMKNATRVSLILAVCMVVPAFVSADSMTFRVPNDGKSRATFVSDAPLETMVGKSSKVTGELTVDPADITKTKGSFKVPVVSLRTDNDLRDEHLQGDGWLDAKKNPNIHFEITEVLPGKKGSKELKQNKDTKVQVKGKFTAHGITKPVTAKGTAKWSGDSLRIKADFTVKLEDHEISVPSIVRLKVANEIAVSVDLRAIAK